MPIAATVTAPYEYFANPQAGRPVADGYIYIGVQDLDPEIPANQIPVIAVQEDGTEVPLIQPIRTNGGGLPTYNSSVIQLKVEVSVYSIKVLDRNSVLVYYQDRALGVLNGMELFQVTFDSIQEAADTDLTGVSVIRTKSFWTWVVPGEPLGGATYYADNTTGTPQTLYADNSGFYDLNGNGFKLVASEEVTPCMFGAIGAGVETAEVQYWLNYADANSVAAHNDLDITVGGITIPTGITFSGEGSLIGETTGIAPDVATLRATNSAGRLAALQAHWNSQVTLTNNVSIFGVLRCTNLLFVGTLNAFVKGTLELSTCSFHGCGIRADNAGYISAPALIVSDSSGTGLHAYRGGVIESDGGAVISSSSRNVFVQGGGVISFVGGDCVDGLDEGVYLLYSGTVIANLATIDGNAANGVIINYGGDVNIANATITNNGASGVVCESGGSVFANAAIVANNTSRGCTVVHGGFINVKTGEITGNGSFAAQANGSGIINISGTLIDDTNNSGGEAIRANGSGRIDDLEGPGGTNKTALTNANYSPAWSRSRGATFVGDFAAIRFLLSVGSPTALSIVSGAITVNNSYSTVDTEGNAASDSLVTINGGAAGDILILTAEHSARTVTVEDGTGNIQLAGSNFDLDHANDVIALIYNGTNWLELLRSDNT